MASSHLSATGRALYRVFVAPALRQEAVPPLQHVVKAATRGQYRSFTRRSATPRAPEVRAQKWNSQITAKVIHLVDPETGRLSEDGPRTTYDVMNSLDITTHRLVQVTADEPGNRNFVPVCKIVHKQETWEADRRKKLQAKEAKRSTAKAGALGMKTLELNWAIDGNDLAHRLLRLKEFLGEGRRVEVALAAKKRGRRATLEECEDVLKRVRDAVDGVSGAKERSPLEGKLGKFATVVYQGRAVTGTSSSTNAEAVDLGGDSQESAQQAAS